MANCIKQITTPSGVFTFYGEEVEKCVARKRCAEKGQILAPILSTEDAQALLQATDETSCDFHNHVAPYHIGLDILKTKCGNKEEKIFSNGVVFDEEIHGKVYRELDRHWFDCRYAGFLGYANPPQNPLLITTTECNRKLRYICLKPADKTADPLVSESHVSSSFAYLNYASVPIVLIAIAVIARLMWKNKSAERELRKLKENLPTVKC